MLRPDGDVHGGGAAGAGGAACADAGVSPPGLTGRLWQRLRWFWAGGEGFSPPASVKPRIARPPHIPEHCRNGGAEAITERGPTGTPCAPGGPHRPHHARARRAAERARRAAARTVPEPGL